MRSSPVAILPSQVSGNWAGNWAAVGSSEGIPGTWVAARKTPWVWGAVSWVVGWAPGLCQKAVGGDPLLMPFLRGDMTSAPSRGTCRALVSM